MTIAKGIGIFLCGAAAGTIGTYLYMTKHNKIEYELVAVPGERDADSEKANAESKEERDSKITVERVDPDEEIKEAVGDADRVIAYHKYATVSDTEDPTDEEIDAAAEAYQRQHEEDLSFEPEEITENQFDETRLDFSKESVCVYQDGVVVSEEDVAYLGSTTDDGIDPIDNSYFGEELLEAFLADESRDQMFIRNRKIGVDYELLKASCTSDQYSEKHEGDVQNE